MQRPLTTTWCTRLLLPLGLAASVAGNALAQQQGVAPAWSVTNLGTLDGARTEFSDFNNHGQVVGTAYPDFPSPARRAFLYDAGRMTAIPPLPGLRFSEGLGINDRGQVIGSARDVGIHRGFLYSGGQLTPLVPPGSISTRPVGINGRGDVLLDGLTSTDNSAGYIYSNGTYNNIGTLGGPSTFPSFMNDRGQVTGSSQLANGVFQGFFYSEGRMVPLATTGVARPAALNNAGQVAGSYNGSAAIFHEGQITSLGNLGGDESRLSDINDAGEAVGTIDYDPQARYHESHAFIFSDGQVQDLHTSFSYGGLQRFFSSVAGDINELGQVLVAATFLNAGGYGFHRPPLLPVGRRPCDRSQCRSRGGGRLSGHLLPACSTTSGRSSSTAQAETGS